MGIILASASPRRRELMKKLGLPFSAVTSDFDEREIAYRSPKNLAVQLSLSKAADVFHKHGGIVIGCDTVVALGGKVLNKPRDASEAEAHFRALCSHTHSVITGVSIVWEQGKVSDYCKTLVTFGAYDDSLVKRYIAAGLCYDKAGGYGIQDEMLAPLITSVEGDRDNVVGLPVAVLERLIKENLNGKY